MAAVLSDGTVMAIAPGDATITVTTADGGFTDSCDVTIGRKSLSNAEAVKITAFADVNRHDVAGRFQYNPTLSSPLTAGTSFQAVSTSVDLGAFLTNHGQLWLDMDAVMEAANLSSVTLAYTATLNGIDSVPHTLDISALFLPGTTAGDMRAAKAALTGPFDPIVTGGFIGHFPLTKSGAPVMLPSTIYFGDRQGATGHPGSLMEEYADYSMNVYLDFVIPTGTPTDLSFPGVFIMKNDAEYQMPPITLSF